MKLWSVFSVVLCLTVLFLLLPACNGGGDDKTATSTSIESPNSPTTQLTTANPTPTFTSQPPTNTPVSSNPVKIGAIAPWSGPMAMTGMLADQIIKLVEKQVKDSGGILGGKDVKVVRYDNRGSVAEAIGGATKLLTDDKVSALVFGGASGADNEAVADFAEANHILYICYSGIQNMAEKKFTVTGSVAWDAYVAGDVDFIEKLLKPKTVALLASELADSRRYMGDCKKIMEAAATTVVSEQYTPLDTSDFTPYLTRIKYANPEVLLTYYGPSEVYLALAKQSIELGGWGDMKVVATAGAVSAVKLQGAQGWYIRVLWTPGLPYPGAVKFEQDFQAMYGRLPGPDLVFFYNPLWTAINAIELAGTDTDLEKIAQAARSGNLTWDTPMGTARYTANGDSGLRHITTHVEDKKLVIVQVPE